MTPPGAEAQTPADLLTSDTMTDTHERTHRPDPDDIAVRDVSDEQADDGLFRIRMPVTSTAEARDGVAFDREKVEGFATQIRDGTIPLFLDHGRNETTGHRYSALGKIGYLDNPELRERDAAADLVTDIVAADPDELDADAGTLREALATIRTQARLGIPLASSIGWSDDTGERDLPGDADLLEASIVGIPSDARTTTDEAAATPAAMARAVDAASTDFDVDRFVRELQRQADGVDTVQVPAYDEAANPDDVAWDGHDLEDFADLVDDPSPQDSAVYEKFAYSETGFPPDDDAEFDSLGYPLVTVDGTLLWQALTDAAEVHPAGLEGDEETAMASVLIELAESEFPDEELPDMGDDADTNSMSDTDTDESGEEPGDTNDDGSDGISAEEFRSEMLEMQRNQTEMLDTLADALRQDDEDDDGDDEEGEDDDEGGDDEDGGENAAGAGDERTVTIDGEERSLTDAVDHLREQVADAAVGEAQTTDHPSDDGDGDDDRDADADTDTTDDDTTDFWS